MKSEIDRGSKEKSHLECHLRLRNRRMKSHESGDLLDHFERDFGLACVFSS